MSEGRRYIVVAWHDIGRIVKDTLPTLYPEALGAGARPASRVNVVDEEGRIIFGPPLRSGEFTVGVRFPTTLYNWRLQVSPTASEELASRVQSRKTLEITLVSLSCIVIIAGVAAILLAVQRERKINEQKSEFVANVSHELKTPLALVRMFAEMLQSGRVSSDDKRKEYLDIIVNESERLSSLIENVLDFAKVERGREAYDFAEGDVGAAVSRAVQVLRYRAERESMELDVNIDDGLPPARIDDRAIQLAVMNLVDNAIKYAAGGKIVRVSVKDVGPGHRDPGDRRRARNSCGRADPHLRALRPRNGRARPFEAPRFEGAASAFPWSGTSPRPTEGASGWRASPEKGARSSSGSRKQLRLWTIDGDCSPRYRLREGPSSARERSTFVEIIKVDSWRTRMRSCSWRGCPTAFLKMC